MKDEIKITVSSYGEGRNLMLVYKDPITGKKVAKSSGTTDRTKAERAAGVWQDELNTGRYVAPSKLTWDDFRKRYEAEKSAAMCEGTQTANRAAFDHLERIVNPDRLCKLTANVIGRFLMALHGEGLSDATVAKTARHLKAALRWGERQGFLGKAPLIEMPKRQKGAKMMKGRAILGEEFDRMIAAAPKVRRNDAPAWQRLLRGLWFSGLRLGEALALSWEPDAPFHADLTGKHPRFRILGEAQKSGRDEVLPMTPDFAQLLMQTPEGERAGPVFKLNMVLAPSADKGKEVGRIISKIGKKALIIVDKGTGKHASAHDLRRSFGTRWAKRVMPAVLKRLMRHSDISTTMGYYVDMDADEMAGELWAKFGTQEAGNTLCNTPPKNTVIPAIS